VALLIGAFLFLFPASRAVACCYRCCHHSELSWSEYTPLHSAEPDWK